MYDEASFYVRVQFLPRAPNNCILDGMEHDTPYARWMRRHGLTHRHAADILGISESTSQQYVTGINRTTGKPIEPPPPVRKLMVAKDTGAEYDTPPADFWGIGSPVIEKTA